MNKQNIITDDKLDKYFAITKEAMDMAKDAFDEERLEQAKDFFNMISCYYSDAGHFREKGEYVLAYGALNYAHGWLDAGARSKIFKVNDSRLFTVDEE